MLTRGVRIADARRILVLVTGYRRLCTRAAPDYRHGHRMLAPLTVGILSEAREAACLAGAPLIRAGAAVSNASGAGLACCRTAIRDPHHAQDHPNCRFVTSRYRRCPQIIPSKPLVVP